MFHLEAFPSEPIAKRFRPQSGLVTQTTLRGYPELIRAVATLCGYDPIALKEGAGETGRAEHDWTAYAATDKSCFLIRWQVGSGLAVLAFGTDMETPGKKPRCWLAGLADELASPALSALNHHVHGWRGAEDLWKAFKVFGDGTIPQGSIVNDQFSSMWIATDDAGGLPATCADEAWRWLGAIAVRPFPATRPPAEIIGRYRGELQPGDRLLGGRPFDPSDDLLRVRADEPLPAGSIDILSRTSVRRAQAMMDALLAPRLAPPESLEDLMSKFEPSEDPHFQALARERFVQLHLTTLRPPKVEGTEAFFSLPFKAKPGQQLIGTQDPADGAPFPMERSRDLIHAVIRETLEFAKEDTIGKPKGFLDGLGWNARVARLGFRARPIRRPYYLPMSGLPCRVDRQATVWREGEDLSLAVDFGVQGDRVLFGRLSVENRRGRA